MNYKKIYFSIIRNRRKNPLDSVSKPIAHSYSESHHIFPRSFGGGNHKANLVRLTAREHFIVHFLLYKMYKHRSQVLFPNSKVQAERYRKMAYAFNLMIRVKSKQFDYINSRVFEQIKQEINCEYVKYPPEQVKEMYNFYVNNKINKKTIHVFNQKFDTKLSSESIRKIFYRNDLLLSEHEVYKVKRIRGGKKYTADKIQQIFNFCLKNKITAKTIHLVNDKFNTNFLYESLTRLFLRYGLRLSDYKQSTKYSKVELQKMFKFYVQNKITKHNIHVFNERFNTEYTYASILRLFQRHGLKISDYDKKHIKIKEFKNALKSNYDCCKK